MNEEEQSIAWTCTVCGKQNQELGKKQRLCITCGREKDAGSKKKLKKPNRVDFTSHTTEAKRDEVIQARRLKGEKAESFGKQQMFLFNKSDYEVIAREQLKDEASTLLDTLRDMKFVN